MGRDVLQSRIEVDKRTYLVRVFVDVDRRLPRPSRRIAQTRLKSIGGARHESAYDARTDTLTVLLKEGVRVAENDEDKPGVILDYDDQGNLLSLEILDASRRVTETRKIEYQATE